MRYSIFQFLRKKNSFDGLSLAGLEIFREYSQLVYKNAKITSKFKKGYNASMHFLELNEYYI